MCLVVKLTKLIEDEYEDKWWRPFSMQDENCVTFVLKWPKGWYDNDDSGNNQVETCDPNVAYRWYLEKYIGCQGKYWDWHINDLDSLTINIHKSKEEHASIMIMKWG
jgi:hypothetical protein